MRNGYAESIMVSDTGVCALCGQREGYCAFPSPNGGEKRQMYFNKLDRHEPWGGANRQKSKALGLWVTLCRECHEETHRVLICRNGSRPRRAGTLDDSGKTSFSKLKRCFNFEEEEQRNE